MFSLKETHSALIFGRNLVSLHLTFLHVRAPSVAGAQGQLKALLLEEQITSWSTGGHNEHNTGRALDEVLCVARVKAEITRLLILPFCKTLGFDL